MSEQRNNTPAPITERLLTQPRRTAGMDSHREPVRLGEIGSDGHLVGYIDEHGLAWESLAECLVATHGARLAEALALPDHDPRRDQLVDQVVADVPDELIAEVAREAAGQLYLRDLGP
jgi:hypothetical protein